MATIAIVDDHELLAETLRLSLVDAGFNARRIQLRALGQLIDDVLAVRTDLVLLDLDLGPFGDALPVIAPLSRAGVRVVVVTGIVDPLRIAAALEQGAIGFRSKADGFDALVESARAALTTTHPLDPATRVTLLERLRRARAEREQRLAPFRRLTQRERAALTAMSCGLSVHEIAAEWVVSDATVRTHVRGVLAKLDVRSQLAAVGLALRSGWLEGQRAELSSPCSTQRAVHPVGVTCTTIRRRQRTQ